MILILTNQAVFETLSVVRISPLAQGIFILPLNQADVIGDQSDGVTQNACFLWALCAAISGEISILTKPGQSLGEGFLYQESAVGRVHRYVLNTRLCTVIHSFKEISRKLQLERTQKCVNIHYSKTSLSLENTV